MSNSLELLCAVALAFTFVVRAVIGPSPVAAWESALYCFIIGGNLGQWLGYRRGLRSAVWRDQ